VKSAIPMALLLCALSVACAGRGDRDAPTFDVRIATLNIYGIQGDWKQRRPVLADCIVACDADVLCFQEVMIGPGDPPALDQAAWLASVLGFHIAFNPMVTYADGSRLGLAVASRFPVALSKSVPLPAPTDDPRIVQHVALDTPAGELHVYNTHLSYQTDATALRASQVAKILDVIRDTDDTRGALPPVLVGDFNATPETDEVTQLRELFVDAFAAMHPERDGYTRPSANPLNQSEGRPLPYADRRIDYVFIGAATGSATARILNADLFCDTPAGTPPVWPSDHCGVAATIRLTL